MQKRRSRRRGRYMAGLMQNRLRLLLVAAPVVIVVLLLILLRPANQLLNTPELLRAQRLGVLRVGVRTDVPGFSENEDGLEVAIAREVARRVFPELPPEVALSLTPVTAYTALPKLNSGEIDLAFAQIWNTGNEDYAYSAPYYEDSVRLVCRSGDERASFAGSVVGMIEGSAAERVWKAYAQKQEYDSTEGFKYYASYPDLVAALKGGKIAFIAACGAQLPRLLEEGLSLHETPIGSVGYVAASYADSSAFAMMAGEVIQDMKEDGTLQALIEQYGLNMYQHK
ncbi:MAG TPA: transporter substrate-binding domain-containing protein [Feifaniaceae bacterium]|nr:transporter substrate-binding domain-containing protein [Feifaniaceae bacterium]